MEQSSKIGFSSFLYRGRKERQPAAGMDINLISISASHPFTPIESHTKNMADLENVFP